MKGVTEWPEVNLRVLTETFLDPQNMRLDFPDARIEVDILPNAFCITQGDGDYGHNGLKNIIARLEGPNYFRIRMAISRPSSRQNPVDSVLKLFPAAEKK